MLGRAIRAIFRPFYEIAFSVYHRHFFLRSVERAQLQRRTDAVDSKKQMLLPAMEYAHYSVQGDYLEFGVYRGSTFALAFNIAARWNKLREMRFYAFDSFEGLPASRGVDVQGFLHDEFAEGALACGVDEFRAKIARQGVDLSRVEIVPGWYDDVLNEQTRNRLPLRKAAIVWIDCDLYESTVPVLEFVTPYVQDGTLIAFDDWFCFHADPERGEQRAFREWLERHPEMRAVEFLKFGWHGNSFILRRISQSSDPK
jgi:hypothetical protein